MNSEKNGTVCWYSNASPNKVRTPDLSASAITSVSNRLFPMPGGPSMTSTPPRPCSQRRHQRADHFQLGRPPPNRRSHKPLAADIKSGG